MNVNIKVAGKVISCGLRYDDTAGFLNGWITDEPADTYAEADVSMIDEILRITPEVGSRSCAEFNALAYDVSRKLVPFGSVIFHGCAFIWRKKVWIFTAPSGTGKTTQYVQWKRRYGDEIEILNGDKPVIMVDGDSVYVSCSPWKGKERMGNPVSAPLGGIIILSQAEENTVTRLSVRAAAPSIYRRFVLYGTDSDEMKQVCAIEEKMLKSVPVWLLRNLGDLASAELTHDALCAYLDGENE